MSCPNCYGCQALTEYCHYCQRGQGWSYKGVEATTQNWNIQPICSKCNGSKKHLCDQHRYDTCRTCQNSNENRINCDACSKNGTYCVICSGVGGNCRYIQCSQCQ